MSATTVYMDHAATTPVDSRVLASMQPFFSEQCSNPSALYAGARSARLALDNARSRTAGVLGARPSEVIFTSGGTESDNAALKGVVWASPLPGKHIITTAIEHHAVLYCCSWLERFGVETTYLDVDKHGMVDPQAVADAIRPTTVLISVMHANNEIGTLQPLKEISEIAHRRGIVLHTDAVQSVGHVPIDVKELGVDLLSLSAHKVYGPKGVGALYVRRGTPWIPLLQGGGQERNRRAGTENVPGIVGLAAALEIASATLGEEASRLIGLRDRLIEGVLRSIPDARLNGHPSRRLPNNANFSFAGADGESILLSLDRQGIAASSGSACTAGSIDPSHVLQALGLSAELTNSAVRFTLGRGSTLEHVQRVHEVLPGVVARVRALASPSRAATARGQ